ncbi:MAG: amidohydrolase family protein [Mycobacterium sp.]|nr:amidohydrolase family protein [Mycobacterium sp.]
MLIQRASLLDGRVVDIRLGDAITEVADALAPAPGEEIVDAGLGTVIPGLHDHHLHLRAAAAAMDSVTVGPPQVRAARDFALALTTATPGPDGWIRAVGYHESVAGPLDRHALDALSPLVPLRVQHNSGAMWFVNSIGLQRIGQTDHPDGRLFRTDGLWPRELGIDRLSGQLASFGVTGITEATPGHGTADIAALASFTTSGRLRQRLHCMASPGTESAPGLTIGPVKMILDDDRLDLDLLADLTREAHQQGRSVAVHCVTAAQLVVAMGALQVAGPHPSDRIEHAAVVPDDCLNPLAELGVTVVTQPNFIAERGDFYLADIPANEHHELWRVASLRGRGIPVAFSTDAPFGHTDPWAAMRAATTRRTPAGDFLSPNETVSAAEAVTMFLGHADAPARPRTIAPGQPGDVCILTPGPDEALASLAAEMVSATIISGTAVYSRGAVA